MKKIILASFAAIALYGCNTNPKIESTNQIKPYSYIDGHEEKYKKANDLWKVGKKSESNRIMNEIAREGHPEALKRLAIKRYDNGTPVYKHNKMDKGCENRQEGTINKLPGWPVENLALQGESGAIYAYWKCVAHPEYVTDLRAAKIAMEYLAEKGDVKAILELLKYDMTYANQAANNIASGHGKAVREPYKSNYPVVRRPNLEESAKWDRMYKEIIQNNIDTVGRDDKALYFANSYNIAYWYMQTENYAEARKWFSETVSRINEIKQNENLGAKTTRLLSDAKERLKSMESLSL